MRTLFGFHVAALAATATLFWHLPDGPTYVVPTIHITAGVTR